MSKEWEKFQAYIIVENLKYSIVAYSTVCNIGENF